MHHIVTVEAVVKHATERAVLINNGDRDAWLPLVHVEISLRSENGISKIDMPEWLAVEKRLI